ncbi:DNA mismatch repair endonuclease MutL [Thermosynechococcus sp. PP45]|uniref:DNA mismatch repair endonuclease MutL n=2 Tax=unclassified Thermosynechococcus TaxID=2622553 RepID=UPI002671035F|nr:MULTISPECIES: DNA mismatch repair endonuclease MutL [unclassified Thermosynechococcus]WKT80741.1 DNA mismatch repair endonuclease MutL [Thermosynechococcus sp. PP45]WNC24353.1 DNA mismatch repair endonuclease MutL [Thermosynechococcus sp. PP551]WNC26931.1 DNA mismatch repair endonuclease MutL [Thermosynechococcus sp. PP555]
MAAMSDGLTVVPLPLQMQRAIAAAETLDSLATVVQELVENALDAGASRIHLHWRPSAWHLEVTDNGEGIRWADLTQVALPYTSSKLPPSGELADITTLGFRGQALRSLAQMAQLTICSRHREAETGWQVSYDAQGQVRSQRPLGMAVGTRVIVEQLFQDWPQRQQGANPKQVQRRLQEIALCFPQVAWHLLKDGKRWHHWPAVASLGDRLLQLIPQLHPQDLRQMSDAQIELVLAPPDRHHRPRPDGLGVAVNGRWVELHSDPSWQQVILEAFGCGLPRQRFPLCIAHLHLPPAAIDWSAEPQKRTIYLREPEQWQALLVERIGQLLACPSIPLSDASSYQVLKAAEPPNRYRTLLSPNSAQVSLPSLKVVGQLHNMYIIVEHAEGIWLIEQHIAHERVLYEQIETDWQVVELEQPVLVDSLTETQVQRLQDWGLAIAPFGVQVWAVRRVPALLRDRPDVVAALIELSQVADLTAAKVAVACRSAIRNGTPLTLAEMQTLVDQWYRCRQPHTCPHGRPICLQLQESSLARFFRRHWVVGKSHGI